MNYDILESSGNTYFILPSTSMSACWFKIEFFYYFRKIFSFFGAFGFITNWHWKFYITYFWKNEVGL